MSPILFFIFGCNNDATKSIDTGSPNTDSEVEETAADTEDSDTGSAVASIGNIGPTISDVLITPSIASIGNTLTCSLTVDDPDLETYTENFAWTNVSTGAILGVANTLLLEGSLNNPTDEIQCTATVVDPSGASGSNQNSIVLVNQDPIINSVSFTPQTAALDT